MRPELPHRLLIVGAARLDLPGRNHGDARKFAYAVTSPVAIVDHGADCITSADKRETSIVPNATQTNNEVKAAARQPAPVANPARILPARSIKCGRIIATGAEFMRISRMRCAMQNQRSAVTCSTSRIAIALRCASAG